MDGAEETESTGSWVGRAAVRYLAWLAVGWISYVVYIIHSHIPDAWMAIPLVGGGLLIWLGVPTVVLLAVLAPRLRAKWHRPLATVSLCAPVLLVGMLVLTSGMSYGLWESLILLLFQIIFGAVLLPEPRSVR